MLDAAGWASWCPAGAFSWGRSAGGAQLEALSWGRSVGRFCCVLHALALLYLLLHGLRHASVLPTSKARADCQSQRKLECPSSNFNCRHVATFFAENQQRMSVLKQSTKVTPMTETFPAGLDKQGTILQSQLRMCRRHCHESGSCRKEKKEANEDIGHNSGGMPGQHTHLVLCKTLRSTMHVESICKSPLRTSPFASMSNEDEESQAFCKHSNTRVYHGIS